MLFSKPKSEFRNMTGSSSELPSFSSERTVPAIIGSNNNNHPNMTNSVDSNSSNPILMATAVAAAANPNASMKSPESLVSTPGNDRRYNCEECGHTFTRKHNLKSHLLIHSKSKPHICTHCNANFRRAHDLKRHQKLHTGEKPFQCIQCGRTFARSDALVRHNNSHGGCNLGSSSTNDPPKGNLIHLPLISSRREAMNIGTSLPNNNNNNNNSHHHEQMLNTLNGINNNSNNSDSSQNALNTLPTSTNEPPALLTHSHEINDQQMIDQNIIMEPTPPITVHSTGTSSSSGTIPDSSSSISSGNSNNIISLKNSSSSRIDKPNHENDREYKRFLEAKVQSLEKRLKDAEAEIAFLKNDKNKLV